MDVKKYYLFWIIIIIIFIFILRGYNKIIQRQTEIKKQEIIANMEKNPIFLDYEKDECK